MRVVQNEQKTFGKVDFSKRVFDSKSRDDMPRVLKGLQSIYTTISLRYAIFQLLESRIAPEVSKFIGRPGMFQGAGALVSAKREITSGRT